ncbi:deoxyribodipyrimidine photo-lyase [Orbus hercynius]|uniref:Deoxyribodipyrimidine photo-lyase n=1 Tax=Orbus hercynius TaxID=593135 RepID=A0A495RK94_9GAMM|nr:deoxyribodipyrimidine photo-lyase [Orbus hercynius]RKS87586.1 deoxyribodipyrimidine photo-lyase [Orbus hercynius]
MATHLVWFRHDLRVTDNTALYQACQDDDAQVIAIYIATPKQWHEHHMSARQAWLIEQHIQHLQKSLAELNIPLLYRQTETFDEVAPIIQAVCQQYQVSDLFYNKQYQWNERQRDKAVTAHLANTDVRIQAFDDAVFFAPGSVLTGAGKMYQVYTPFRHKCCEQLSSQNTTVYAKPKKRISAALSVTTDSITPFSYTTQRVVDFPTGEPRALSCLRDFCQKHVDRYLQQRDYPALDATSHLSAYLALGVLSVRQCFARLQMEYPDLLHATSSGAFGWFSQLLWREFYLHLLFMYPKLSKNKPFIDWTERVQWRENQADFDAWKNGLTGYPIVDAAMRQLNQTGWMHNRLRMIVASFLVKDLLIDWHRGEHYFMSQLIDGDLALNNGGWQWAASTGTDAAPYFRIFNPTTQGERFDPNGQFIRQYLPELALVPDEAIHQPHKWAQSHQVKLDYPAPIVCHAKARLYTLAAFKAAR